MKRKVLKKWVEYFLLVLESILVFGLLSFDFNNLFITTLFDLFSLILIIAVGYVLVNYTNLDE